MLEQPSNMRFSWGHLSPIYRPYHGLSSPASAQIHAPKIPQLHIKFCFPRDPTLRTQSKQRTPHGQGLPREVLLRARVAHLKPQFSATTGLGSFFIKEVIIDLIERELPGLIHRHPIGQHQTCQLDSVNQHDFPMSIPRRRALC